MNKLFDSKTFKTPYLIAHRGYRARYPENTLAAFDAAINAGFPMIELDVTLSKDRRVVVIHDETLDRTTDGSGPVSDRTLKELKELDAGTWFHPDFNGERLPELSEVFDLVGDRALVNIEVKTYCFETECREDGIEQQVMDLVRSRNMVDRVLISSFNGEILERLCQSNGSPALALISKEPAEKGTVAFCKRIGAVSWHPLHLILTHPQVEAMHGAGIRVFPYNADTPEQAGRVLEMGVDGVIIDDPGVVPQ